jgi:hypothetical protein
MKLTVLLLCCLIGWSMPLMAQVPTGALVTPEAVVAELYKQHDQSQSPFFQTKSRASVDKYFVKKLADLIWKDVVTHQDEVGAIGADPLYNAQDTDIKKFTLSKAVIQNAQATVKASFENFGQKEVVTFIMRQEKAVWKIDNIRYRDGSSLLSWLTAQ